MMAAAAAIVLFLLWGAWGHSPAPMRYRDYSSRHEGLVAETVVIVFACCAVFWRS